MPLDQALRFETDLTVILQTTEDRGGREGVPGEATTGVQGNKGRRRRGAGYLEVDEAWSLMSVITSYVIDQRVRRRKQAIRRWRTGERPGPWRWTGWLWR
jgi:hypothetical protein